MKTVVGSELLFISWILRDGSGTKYISKDNNAHLDNEQFKLSRLSLSEDTWIALGFNSYVVKLRNG